MLVSYDQDSPELAREYDETGNSQFEDGLQLLERLDIRTGMSVLDIGCGTGRLGRFICPKIGNAGRFTGIEPMPERLKIAREKNSFDHAQFHQGTAEDLSAISDSSIDRIVVNWVFHWIEDKPKALGEMRRVLANGGKAGFTLTPKEMSPQSGLSPFMRKVLGNEPYKSAADPAKRDRKNWITTSDMIRIVNESGLSVDDFHIVRIMRRYRDAESAIRHMKASTFGNFMSLVPESLRESFRAELIRSMEPAEPGAEMEFPAYVLFAVISKEA
jgi:ubiquinone/menaquinone biosynthesis C-methylase UbiE